MRTLTSLLAAVFLLAACDDHPCECNCPTEVNQRLQAQVNLRAMSPEQARTVVTCTTDKPCVIDVPVTVDENKKCQAALPYCVICVRKKAGSAKNTSEPLQVTWRLTVDGQATTKYRFAGRRGINLFHAQATGKDDFHSPGHPDPTDKSKFRWIAGQDRSDALAHDALVFPVGVNEPCGNGDPVIVNTD